MVAIHIHDVKEGKLVEPSKEDCEELTIYEHIHATNLENNLVVTNDPIADDASIVDGTLYPSMNFNVEL